MKFFRPNSLSISRGVWLAGALLAGALAAGCQNNKPARPRSSATTGVRLSIPFRDGSGACQCISTNSVRDLLGLPAAPDLGTLGGQSTFAFFADETLTVDPAAGVQRQRRRSQVLPAVTFPQLAACKTGEAAGRLRAALRRQLRPARLPPAAERHRESGARECLRRGAQQDFNTGHQPDGAGAAAVAVVHLPIRARGNARSRRRGEDHADAYEVATQLGYTFLDSTPDRGAAGGGGRRGPRHAREAWPRRSTVCCMLRP